MIDSIINNVFLEPSPRWVEIIHFILVFLRGNITNTNSVVAWVFELPKLDYTLDAATVITPASIGHIILLCFVVS